MISLFVPILFEAAESQTVYHTRDTIHCKNGVVLQITKHDMLGNLTTDSSYSQIRISDIGDTEPAEITEPRVSVQIGFKSNDSLLDIFCSIFTWDETEFFSNNSCSLNTMWHWDADGNIKKFYFYVFPKSPILEIITPEQFAVLYKKLKAAIIACVESIPEDMIMSYQRPRNQRYESFDLWKLRDKNNLFHHYTYEPMEVYKNDVIAIDGDIVMYVNHGKSITIGPGSESRMIFPDGKAGTGLYPYNYKIDSDKALNKAFTRTIPFDFSGDFRDYGLRNFIVRFKYNEKGRITWIDLPTEYPENRVTYEAHEAGGGDFLRYEPSVLAEIYKDLCRNVRITPCDSEKANDPGLGSMWISASELASEDLILPPSFYTAKSLWDYPDTLCMDGTVTLIFDKEQAARNQKVNIRNAKQSRITGEEYSPMPLDPRYPAVDQAAIEVFGEEKIKELGDKYGTVFMSFTCNKKGKIIKLELEFGKSYLWFEEPEKFAELYKKLKENCVFEVPDDGRSLYTGFDFIGFGALKRNLLGDYSEFEVLGM